MYVKTDANVNAMFEFRPRSNGRLLRVKLFAVKAIVCHEVGLLNVKFVIVDHIFGQHPNWNSNWERKFVCVLDLLTACSPTGLMPRVKIIRSLAKQTRGMGMTRCVGVLIENCNVISKHSKADLFLRAGICTEIIHRTCRCIETCQHTDKPRSFCAPGTTIEEQN